MRWAQGRMGRHALTSLKRVRGAAHPAMPVFRAALIALAWLRGRAATPTCVRELRLLAVRRGFRGCFRATTSGCSRWHSSARRALAALGRTRAPREVPALRLFVSFDWRNAHSPDAIFAGPVARYLGLLADGQRRRGGRRAEFRRRVEQAASRSRLAGDGAHAAGLRTDPARRKDAKVREQARARASSSTRRIAPSEELELPASGQSGSAAARTAATRLLRQSSPPQSLVAAGMQREGEVWRFDFGGRVIHLRDSKGIRNPRGAAGARPESRSRPLTPRPARTSRGGRRRCRGERACRAADAWPCRLSANMVLVGSRCEGQGRSTAAGSRICARRSSKPRRGGIPERAARAREEMEMIGSELAAAVGLGWP